MTNRRLVVEAAFGFGPFDTITAGGWVPLLRDDGRERVKAASWTFGRDNELEPHPAGTASVMLWNRDRALDPDNPASAHAGQLLPLVPVRIRSQDVDTLAYTDEFYGYVEGGWEQALAPKGTGDCRLQLVDLLGVIGGWRLPGVFEHAVLSYDPIGFWKLDEADAERVADRSGNGHDGTVNGDGISLGNRVIAPGHAPAARFDVEIDEVRERNTYGFVDLGRSPLVSSMSSALVMVLFRARSVGDLNFRTVFAHGNGNGSAAATATQMYVDTAGRLVKAYAIAGTGGASRTAVSVVDGKPHLAFGGGSSIALDSATLVSSNVTSLVLGTINGAAIGGGPGIQPIDHMDGWIGAVALFADSLAVGVAGRQAILDAYGKLDGLRSDQHIAWALDRVGVPAGMRNLDVGSVRMGPAVTAGRDALEWMRDVAATEQGDLYVDHRNGGVIRFTNRYARQLDTRSTVPQATFSDAPGAAGVVRYPAEGLDVAPNGRDGIINQVTVTWDGGEVVVEDPVSVAAYGPRSRQIDTVATTAAQARSAGEWLIARYSEPRSRIRGATVSQRTTTARDDQVQGLQIGDRAEFGVHPLHTGTPTTVWLWVDGIDNEARGVEWVTSFRFAPVDTFTPWIWGTSKWGEDNLWG